MSDRDCKCRRFSIDGEAWLVTVDGEIHTKKDCGPFTPAVKELPGSSLNPEPGRKDDAGKLPYDLLPWPAVAQVVAVLQYGAKKYAPDNWKQVKDWRRRYFSAACRHLISWVTGEKLDPETGLHHLAHATCCVLFCLDLDSKSDESLEEMKRRYTNLHK